MAVSSRPEGPEPDAGSTVRGTGAVGERQCVGLRGTLKRIPTKAPTACGTLRGAGVAGRPVGTRRPAGGCGESAPQSPRDGRQACRRIPECPLLPHVAGQHAYDTGSDSDNHGSTGGGRAAPDAGGRRYGSDAGGAPAPVATLAPSGGVLPDAWCSVCTGGAVGRGRE